MSAVTVSPTAKSRTFADCSAACTTAQTQFNDAGQGARLALDPSDGSLVSNGPVAVRGVLRSIRETEGMSETDAFEIESKIGIEVFLSEDAREGPKAFKEKRKPEYKNR